MKKLALFLFGLGALAAVGVSSTTYAAEVTPQQNVEQCVAPVPCNVPDSTCTQLPCNVPDTVCNPAPCNPAPCNAPAPCTTPAPGC